MLEKLGFSEKEAKVYLAALEMAESSVQNIAKKAGVNRATTYVILEKLMGYGLISTYEKGKKTIFVAENPQELLHIIREEKNEVEEREKEIKDNLNQLTAIYNREKGKPIVRFFEGADGLESLDRYARSSLRKNSEILSISPLDIVEKLFLDRRKKSLNERIRLGIKSRAIYTYDKGEFSTSQNKAELREGIYIPREKFPLNATITIYPEWGVKLYYYDEIHPYGVAIESQDLARNFKLFFELAWLGGKTMKK